MKAKRALSLSLAAIMVAMSMLGCSQTDTASSTAEGGDTASAAGDTTSGGEEGESGTPEVSHDEEVTFEIYDVAANFQGEQIGWFGKVLKDELNIKLNIIAPQVSGDANSLYQTRTASGNLGDIVILDNADMLDCVNSGLIMNISDLVYSFGNLNEYQEQIDQFNQEMGVGDEGGIYAIPCNMNNNGPTAFVGETVASAPRVPWDYYVGVGAPEMKTTDDLLNMLKDMMEKYPTNSNGDPAYAISMWPDWDGESIANANLIAQWYGCMPYGAILQTTENTIIPLTDDEGGYKKALDFLFKANQMGLVDPDSATQDWTTVCETKMKQKRVYLFWYNWQNGFWNTPSHGESRENYMYVPVEELHYYQQSDSYYGDGRVWGVGSSVDDNKKLRIVEFLDWLASPEGLQYQHSSLEGFIYTVNDDGTYTLTQEGQDRFTASIEVPEEYGGGYWSDGNDQINQWIVGSAAKNPLTGEPYDPSLWASTIEMNKTATTNEWIEMFGEENEVKYMEAHDEVTMLPNINMPLPSDDTDIALIRSQCGDLISDTSWKMVFAADQAEYDQLWTNLKTQLEGLGWDQLVEYDTEKYQPVIDAKIAAME